MLHFTKLNSLGTGESQASSSLLKHPARFVLKYRCLYYNIFANIDSLDQVPLFRISVTDGPPTVTLKVALLTLRNEP